MSAVAITLLRTLRNLFTMMSYPCTWNNLNHNENENFNLSNKTSAESQFAYLHFVIQQKIYYVEILR